MKRAGIQAHSSECEAALQFFLSHVVLPDHRARYLDLIGRPTSRRKFLYAIHRDLAPRLDPAVQIGALSPALLRMPGYRFSPYDDCFGEAADALGDVLPSQDESFLTVSADGRLGIYEPDLILNDRAYYAVQTP